MKKWILGLSAMMLMTISACKRDVYGDVFVNRDPVTFHVQSEEGQSLSNVSLKAVEVDGFDNDPIVGRTQYAYTDAEGVVTVDAARDNREDLLGERTTRFTFTATDYVVFDTVFNEWEGIVDIVLYKE